MMKSELYISRIPIVHRDEYDGAYDKYKGLFVRMETLLRYISDMESLLANESRLKDIFIEESYDIWHDVVVALIHTRDSQKHVEELKKRASERAKDTLRRLTSYKPASRQEKEEFLKGIEKGILDEDEEYQDALVALENARAAEAEKRNEYRLYQIKGSLSYIPLTDDLREEIEADIQSAREEVKKIEAYQIPLALDKLDKIYYSDSGYKKTIGSRKPTKNGIIS